MLMAVVNCNQLSIRRRPNVSIILLLSLLALLPSVKAVRQLRIISPLQALTIWDIDVKKVLEDTPRKRFLPRFRAGLQAEMKARNEWSERRKRQKLKLDAAAAGDSDVDWSARAEAIDRRMRKLEAGAIEKAFDYAVDRYDKSHGKDNDSNDQSSRIDSNNSKYQFVGVINPAGNSGPPVTWYARKKPKSSKWSVRLVHVDRDAIIKDLFKQGKADIFAKYDNTGKKDRDTNRIVVTSEYSVRERSWKNLWNFSPIHFFTDSSGMYWRERRLQPGLYTDGNSVYEATYRYRDGRNGMRSVSSFQKFLTSKAVSKKQKEKVLKRLKDDAPDVVLE